MMQSSCYDTNRFTDYVTSISGTNGYNVDSYGKAGNDNYAYPNQSCYATQPKVNYWPEYYEKNSPAELKYYRNPEYDSKEYQWQDTSSTNICKRGPDKESSQFLKKWLDENKCNPYPTRDEKIMLAIIARMTIAQISTWFANARRRLKQKDQMTWIPKHGCKSTPVQVRPYVNIGALETTQ